jgi:hypothetical protein
MLGNNSLKRVTKATRTARGKTYQRKQREIIF